MSTSPGKTFRQLSLQWVTTGRHHDSMHLSMEDLEDDNNSVIFRESHMELQLKPLMDNGDLASPLPSTPINVSTEARVTFNVGGVTFQTSEKTLLKQVKNKNFLLSNPRNLIKYYDEPRKEYFFDRDPEVFRSILNYWRSGHLHLPSTMCGLQVEEDLKFWGLKELDIEPCCWNNYNTWMQTIKALKKVERDRDPAYLHAGDILPPPPSTKYQRLKMLTWKILTDPSFSVIAQVYAYFSLAVVVLSIFSFCASTHKLFQISSTEGINATSLVPDTVSSTITPNNTFQSNNHSSHGSRVSKSGRMAQAHPALVIIDIFCLAIFTAEYLLRLACAKNRLKFVISVIAVLDLLAILPDYIEFIVNAAHSDMNTHHAIIDFMQFLRLMRAFRIFRLIRRVPGLWILMYTLKASFKELFLMLVFLLVGTLLFSSVIYFVDDPDVFISIPHGFWWAIVTMTTVGYGDMTPSTALGQVVGSVTAVCGVLIIGFTIPSLVNSFITYFNHIEFIVQKERLLSADADSKNRVQVQQETHTNSTGIYFEFPHRRADVITRSSKVQNVE